MSEQSPTDPNREVVSQPAQPEGLQRSFLLMAVAAICCYGILFMMPQNASKAIHDFITAFFK